MKNYHLVGIKGSGMSALAQILHDMGENVQGSDVEKRFFTQEALERRGVVMLPFSEKNIQPGQTVIVSNAYQNDHPEVAKARELDLAVYRYHQFLGALSRRFTGIAVCGSHGKTTTTGLLAHVLEAVKPTSYLIGDGSGKGEKNSHYFVFEACEYRRHFLSYEPDFCIMTNVDYDHPDYYKDIDDVFDAFQAMAYNVRRGIFACGDDARLQKLKTNVPIIYYGLGEQNDFQAKDVRRLPDGTAFDVYVRNTFHDTFRIPSFGAHNVLNALSVIALCEYEKVPTDIVKDRLQTFQGVQRRFSEKAFGDQIVIDDYAHHPAEIKATIAAAREKYPDKPVVAVFQPHTFTRTAAFLDEFAESLQEAETVFLCDIFGSARERRGELTIDDLREKIPGAQLFHEKSAEELARHRNAVVLFMGAGDIQKYQNAYEQFLTS